MQNQIDILNLPSSDTVPTNASKRSLYQRFMLGLVIIVGALFLNIALYFILVRVFRVNYLFSNAWAWLAYVLFLYITRKYYYFRHTAKGFKAKWRELYRFMGLRIITGILDMVLMFIMVSIINTHPMNAKIVVIAIITVLNLVFTNFWIFKPAR